MGLRDKIDGTTVNTFLVGDGVAGDKYIRVDTGATDLPGFRRLDSSAKWEYSNDGVVWFEFGTGGGGGDKWKPEIDVAALITIGEGVKVVANDFPALEVSSGKTRYGVCSVAWQTTPATNVILKLRFVLAESGSGSYVRVAAKLKAIAVGEDTSVAFTSSQFAAVSISPTNIGPIYEGSITFAAALFAAGDTVAMHIGRDGGNILGAGSNDDFNKPIDIIAAEVTYA